MDLTPHLHPAAAAAAALAGYALDALCRTTRRPGNAGKAGDGPAQTWALRYWAYGLFSTLVSALVLAEVLARLGIGSFVGGALGGLALSLGLYAVPRLADGAGPATRHSLLPIACRAAQFTLMGAVIGGLH